MPLIRSAGFLLVAVTLVLAADEPIKSGPQPGEYIPAPFHPLNLTGDRAGSRHCLVCKNGLHPVVLFFAREPVAADQPLGQLLKRLDAAIAKYPDAYLGSFVVFLSDAANEERDMLRAQIEQLGKDLELKHVVLCLDAAAGPQEYQVHKDADLTVILYYRHKVVVNRVFTKDKPLTNEDVEAIAQAVDRMIPKKKTE